MTAYNKDMVKELQSDLQTMMQAPEFDLYQFAELEDAFSDDMAVVLANNEELKQKVTALFSDPYQYIQQEKIAAKINDKELGKVLDSPQLMAEVTEKLLHLSAEDMVAVFDSDKFKAEHNPLADKTVELLKVYHKQTDDLSDKDTHADLRYTEYACDERWTDKQKGLNSLLDMVGKFTENPEIETLVEEKIARIFAHYDFYDKQNEFYNASTAGREEFGRRMLEEIGQNKPTAEFYVKNAPAVLGQGAYQDMYMEFVHNIPPKIRQEHPDIYARIVDDFIQAEPKKISSGKKERYTEIWREELRQSPDSELAEFYTENACKYLTVEQIGAVVDEFADALQKEHPELSAKLVGQAEAMAEYDELRKHRRGYWISPLWADNLQESLKVLQTEELTDKDLPYCYYLAQKTGLKCYVQAAERILAENERVDMTVEIDDFDYKPVFKSFRENADKFDKLEIFNIKDELMSADDVTEFYEVLMQNKPKNLYNIRDPKFSIKQAISLMEKYPELGVHIPPARYKREDYDRYGDLFMANVSRGTDLKMQRMQEETIAGTRARLAKLFKQAGRLDDGR